MADLDALVSAARAATIRRDLADGYVRELDRWALRPPVRRMWPVWVGAGVALAAAATAVLLIAHDPALDAPAVRIGERVAIVSEPGTSYRVVEATPGATTIEVEHGAVTARLWPGATPHQLVLAGGGVTASAKGTIYELAVAAGRGSVHVAQGSVEVAEHGEVHVVTASRDEVRGAETLRALPGPTVVATQRTPAPTPAPVVVATTPTLPPPPPVVTHAPPVAPAVVPPSIKDRWRDARLLRGQGRFDDAVQACLAIADANDATWSPIALVEAARIEIGPLASPEHAIELAERAIREWPRDALVSEARALRCQALGQLGRAGDCKRP